MEGETWRMEDGGWRIATTNGECGCVEDGGAGF
jgi:hypothetical protein